MMQQPMMQPQHGAMQPGQFNQSPFAQNHAMQQGRTRQHPQGQPSALPKLNPSVGENPFSAPLPDGVKLVPIDENTMKNLGSIGLPPKVDDTPPKPADVLAPEIPAVSAPPVAPGTPVAEAFGAKQPSMHEAFAAFIQNEHNGAIFYTNLSKKAPNSEYQGYLSKIVNNCDVRGDKLGKTYTQLRGETITPAESNIERPSIFTNGLRSAILQETNAIHELARLYESTADPSVAKMLNSQIHSKTGDIALLNMMLTNP